MSDPLARAREMHVKAAEGYYFLVGNKGIDGSSPALFEHNTYAALLDVVEMARNHAKAEGSRPYQGDRR